MSDNQGVFDPDTFMSMSTEEADETKFRPIPEGEYNAVITKIEGRTPKGNSILDITWAIDDESVRAETGMENPMVRQSLFLDINKEGGLERGANKNVQLGRVRAALGQNNPGQPWSPGMMEGQVAKIAVKHRIDGDNTYSDVKGVASL
jgi:hypothetical protein